MLESDVNKCSFRDSKGHLRVCIYPQKPEDCTRCPIYLNVLQYCSLIASGFSEGRLQECARYS